MMDFAVLPPEINSARMYSGPGSGSMLAAAAAWNQLAAEMRAAASSYGSVVSGLTSGNWLGPASTAMATAAAPYLGWMNATAAQAEQTAAQAQAAASAYESAFAATVPPAVIAANRAELASLVATNFLGQNTPAIAATEAQYGEMWAQDAATMYGYAAASAAASRLTPFSAPPQTTTAGAVTRQSAAVTQATTTSASTNAATGSGLTSSLGGLTSTAGSSSSSSGSASLLGGIMSPGSDTSTTGLAGLLNDLDGSNGSLLGSFLNNATVANFSNAFTTSGLMNPTAMIDSVTAFGYLFPAMAGADAGAAEDLFAGLGSVPKALGLAGVPGLGAAVSAEMGHAASLGALSVPQSWGAAAPAFSKVATELPGLSNALGATPLARPTGPVGMPGMPLGGMAGMANHDLEDVPIYGFRPKVMAHPPAAG